MNAFEIIKNDANLTQNNHLMIKQKFDDEYYNVYYEKILKEREERRLRVSSVERKGWTGIPPTENKKIKNESSI